MRGRPPATRRRPAFGSAAAPRSWAWPRRTSGSHRADRTSFEPSSYGGDRGRIPLERRAQADADRDDGNDPDQDEPELDRVDTDVDDDRGTCERREPEGILEQCEQPEAKCCAGDEGDEDCWPVLDDDEPERFLASEPKRPKVSDFDRA